jgi:hypothetical protein
LVAATLVKDDPEIDLSSPALAASAPPYVQATTVPSTAAPPTPTATTTTTTTYVIPPSGPPVSPNGFGRYVVISVWSVDAPSWITISF